MSGNKKRPPLSEPSSQRSGKKIRVGVVRIKDEEAGATVADTRNAGIETVRQRFIALLSEPKNKAGVSNKNIQAEFKDSQDRIHLAEVINELSRESRLHMSKSGADNQLFYTLVAQDVAQKYQGLDVSAKLVLQVIEKAQSNGVWTKDIRLATNIQQQALNKIFKQLEQRRLIKPVKSVTAKAKKLYMLYELTPSKELTGGVWYSGLEFDHEFISELRTFVIHCVRRLNGGQGVTLTDIKNKMIQANVSRIELSLEEVQQLVQTLVYDYHIEKVEDNSTTITTSGGGGGGGGGEAKYVAARRITTLCDFKWWDAVSPDFQFRTIQFEDGVTLTPHELHHHTA